MEDLRSRIREAAKRNARPKEDLTAHRPAGLIAREERVPLTHAHGGQLLGDLRALHPGALAPVFLLQPEDIPPVEKWLFLDTETTGLGGVNTAAFLLGLGRLDVDCLRVSQFLMRDLDGEEEMFNRLEQFAAGCGAVVTFNGKSFDLPLLHGRHLLCRKRFPYLGWAQLDILHAARRVWKMRLGGCSLQALEEQILDIARKNDLSGAEIPGRYFQYLNTRDESLLEDILIHNRLDVLSMASLTLSLYQRLSAPFSGHAQDIYSLGRVFERAAHADIAEQCYRASNDDVEKGCEALAALMRRQGRWQEAVEIYRRIADKKPSPGARIEAAKVFEHRLKDPASALGETEHALEDMRRLGIPSHTPLYESLLHRRVRLRIKCAKREEANSCR